MATNFVYDEEDNVGAHPFNDFDSKIQKSIRFTYNVLRNCKDETDEIPDRNIDDVVKKVQNIPDVTASAFEEQVKLKIENLQLKSSLETLSQRCGVQEKYLTFLMEENSRLSKVKRNLKYKYFTNKRKYDQSREYCCRVNKSKRDKLLASLRFTIQTERNNYRHFLSHILQSILELKWIYESERTAQSSVSIFDGENKFVPSHDVDDIFLENKPYKCFQVYGDVNKSFDNSLSLLHTPLTFFHLFDKQLTDPKYRNLFSLSLPVNIYKTPNMSSAFCNLGFEKSCTFWNNFDSFPKLVYNLSCYDKFYYVPALQSIESNCNCYSQKSDTEICKPKKQQPKEALIIHGSDKSCSDKKQTSKNDKKDAREKNDSDQKQTSKGNTKDLKEKNGSDQKQTSKSNETDSKEKNSADQKQISKVNKKDSKLSKKVNKKSVTKEKQEKALENNDEILALEKDIKDERVQEILFINNTLRCPVDIKGLKLIEGPTILSGKVEKKDQRAVFDRSFSSHKRFDCKIEDIKLLRDQNEAQYNIYNTWYNNKCQANSKLFLQKFHPIKNRSYYGNIRDVENFQQKFNMHFSRECDIGCMPKKEDVQRVKNIINNHLSAKYCLKQI